MKKLLALLPDSMILPIFIIGGVLAGLGAYAIYMSRPHSYLSDNPAACVNCHIMTPYYQSWNHSSHAAWATCNDCHIPHDNLVHTYGFKATAKNIAAIHSKTIRTTTPNSALKKVERFSIRPSRRRSARAAAVRTSS